MSKTEYCAAVVKWPQGWQPDTWEDMPPRVEVVEVVQRSLSFSDVVRWVRRFNHTALSSAERTAWGVILTSMQPAGALSQRVPAIQAAPVSSGIDRTSLERPAPRDGRYGLA